MTALDSTGLKNAHLGAKFYARINECCQLPISPVGTKINPYFIYKMKGFFELVLSLAVMHIDSTHMALAKRVLGLRTGYMTA